MLDVPEDNPWSSPEPKASDVHRALLMLKFSMSNVIFGAISHFLTLILS